jgi:anti-anti-sigma regulatory factor
VSAERSALRAVDWPCSPQTGCEMTGLRVFMMAAREVRGKGSLAMAGPTPHVRQVLDLAGVATFAKMYDTATEAVEALNQSSH